MLWVLKGVLDCRIDSDGLLSSIECLVLVITSSPNIFGGLLSFLLSPILTAHPVDCTSERRRLSLSGLAHALRRLPLPSLGRGDDTVGNPHRAQISQFELFELFLFILEIRQTIFYRAIRDLQYLSQQYPPPLNLPGSDLFG